MTTKESDVGNAAMAHLTSERWDCYPEAQFTWGGPRADIAATRSGYLHVVECKTSLSMTVLDQAIRWTGKSHYVSIAVPAGRRRRISYCVQHLLKHFGLGLLFTSSGIAYWDRSPRLHRKNHASAKDLIAALHPDMKRFSPGGTSDSGYSSPWRRTMDRCVQYIHKHPGVGLKEIIDQTRHHYASDASARSSLRTWLPEDSRVEARREGRLIRYFPVAS